jgi:hypothetical protein
MADRKISIALDDASLAIVYAAIADDDSLTVATFVEELVWKTLDQKRVAFARSRLNAGKKFIALNVKRENRGYESLEQAYITLGLSNDVETFGGIRKVYDEIYVKSGINLAPSQIRLHNIVAVPPPAAHE